MKILTSLFASALFATSLFASSAYAVDDKQIVNEQQVIHTSDGRFHQCDLAGNPDCLR